MKVTRALVLLAVPALVVAALVFEDRPEPSRPSGAAAMAQLMPTAGGEASGSSLWFCAAGTASGPDGVAEQTLVMTSTTDVEAEVTVTAFPDDGRPVSTSLVLEGRGRTTVAVSELVVAPFAAALVETPEAGVVVEHELAGPLGRTSGPCASAASPEWYLPTGTSVLGVQNLVAVFNPFPSPAVVDMTVETDLDTRNPAELQGFVVEPRSVRVVDVAQVVTVRQQLSIEVVARSGLVVVEQLEVVTDDSDVPAGITASLGAPRPAETWYFPVGQPLGASGEVAVDVVVFNPSEAQAEVDVQILVDDPGVTGFVEPFELSIRGGQFSVVSLHEEVRVPTGVGWGAYVQSRNDVPVVPAMTVTAGGPSPLATEAADEAPVEGEPSEVAEEPDEPDAVDETADEPVEAQATQFASPPPDGRAITLGSPLVATEWVVPSAPGGTDLSSTSLQNPSATADAVVEVLRVVDGSAAVVTTVEVPAGTRLSLLDAGDTASSDEPPDDPPEEDGEDPAPSEVEEDTAEAPGATAEDQEGTDDGGAEEATGDDSADGELAAPADEGDAVEPGQEAAADDRRPERLPPIAGVDDGGVGFVVRSDTPIVVGTARVFDGATGLSVAVGLPVLETAALPAPAVSDPDLAPTVILDGLDLPLDDSPPVDDPAADGQPEPEPEDDSADADDDPGDGGATATGEPGADDGEGVDGTTAPAADDGGTG